MHIQMPERFSVEWMLNHIRSSSYGVPYSFVDQHILRRPLWLINTPAVVEFDLSQVGTMELASFQNPPGLMALGGNFFSVTTASGEATTGAPGTEGMGTLVQGFLEESNVSIVEEMINMILGQRAYEANSRVVKAADEMLGQVNNLAR